MSGGEDLSALVDFERRTMRMTLILKEEAVRFTYLTGVKARTMAPEYLGGELGVEATGLVYLLGQWFEEILDGQRRGLAFAAITITLMMMLGLRSLRIGLWSMLPNALPLLALTGYLGLCWDQVDSDVLAIGMMPLGSAWTTPSIS